MEVFDEFVGEKTILNVPVPAAEHVVTEDQADAAEDDCNEAQMPSLENHESQEL